MQSRKRVRLRPAEGWPKGWYYSGEVETVNIEALLDPDGFFNRVILGKDRHEAGPRHPSTREGTPRQE